MERRIEISSKSRKHLMFDVCRLCVSYTAVALLLCAHKTIIENGIRLDEF